MSDATKTGTEEVSWERWSKKRTFVRALEGTYGELVEELFSQPTIKIGELRSIYGAQKYSMQHLTDDEWNKYRTVAFYSKPLDRVIALVQIRGLVKK